MRIYPVPRLILGITITSTKGESIGLLNAADLKWKSIMHEKYYKECRTDKD
jgi:hypothetical protein